MKPFHAALMSMGLILGTGFITSCGNQSQETSNLDIVNGLVIPYDQEPSVVFLTTHLLTRGGNVCTGTFVKPNVVLTAAHCTDYIDNQSIAGANEELEDQVIVIDWDETIDTDDDPQRHLRWFLRRSSKLSYFPSRTR